MDFGYLKSAQHKTVCFIFHFWILEVSFAFWAEGGGGDVNPNFQHWGLFSYGEGRQVYADVYR